MPEPSRKYRVLIVSEPSDDADIFKHALASDYQILFAENGEETLKIAKSDKPPDLILLNTVILGTDPYELCKQLKSDKKIHKTPLIFIGVTSGEASEDKGFERGATDFIRKPFGSSLIKNRVRTHLELMACREKIEEVSYIDGTTGIFNRRRFEEVLDLEWRLGIRENTLLSLIMIRIDRFGAFYDRYLHIACNGCLRQVGKALESTVRRPMDFTARYDRDSFAVILPRTDMKGSALVAEKMRKNIEVLNIPHACSPLADRVTVSTGTVTVVPSKNFSSDFLIEHAKKAVAQAKQGGGNQVRSSDLRPSTPVVPPDFL